MCVAGEFSHLELLLCVATFRKRDYNLHKMKKITVAMKMKQMFLPFIKEAPYFWSLYILSY